MAKIKKVLFLHPNFPGQFKQLAIFLGKDNSYDVKFLCMTNFGNHIQGVSPLVIKGERSQESMDSKKLSEFDKMLFRAESYRKAFLMLDKNNWNPDIVIGHTGWGCGIHVKEIWPKTRFIGYAEWWFEAFTNLNAEMTTNKFLGVNEKSQSKLWHRNRIIGFELSTSNAIVAPSEWQRQQLPKVLQNNCTVITDGIDVEYFAKKAVELSDQPLITYGTRGMEPMRCFKEFINSLPPILKKYPNLRVEIAGEDKICYGGSNPSEDLTWGKWAKKYLESGNFQDRVRWLGHLGAHDYKSWLQRSWCHVYLSKPFVCSWSLLEAISCGNIIVCSKTPPVEEYCRSLKGVLLVDHNNTKEIAQNITNALNMSRKQSKKDLIDARRELLARVSAQASLKGWLRVTGLDLNTSH